MTMIGAAERAADAYPLTPMQQGMLFHALLEPESRAYRQQLRLSMAGPLDADRFEQCWQALVDRHEVLRSVFLWEGRAEPVQQVLPHVAVRLIRHDLDGGDAAAVAAIIEADAALGFHLDQEPPSRLLLLRLGPERHELVWSHHHILLDGWSTGLVLAELQRLYDGASLAPPPPPFRRFVAGLAGNAPAAETFWRRVLDGFTTPTPLVLDRPPMAGAPPSFATRTLALGGETSRRARDFARQRGLALNSLLAGLHGLTLARLGGVDEVCFGVTVAGRPATLDGAQSMVGLFINTVPLRLAVDRSQAVGAWLATVQQRLAEVRDFEQTSLVQLQQWSALPAGMALFQSIVVNENYPLAASDRPFGGVSVTAASIVESSNYPLALVIEENGDGIVLRAIHDVQRLDDAAVGRLLSVFSLLLDATLADPEQPLGRLPLLAAAERSLMLEAWNATARDYDRTVRLEQLFQRRASLNPNALAVRDDHRSLSYGEVEAEANRLAHGLIALGLQPGQMVAVCLSRRAEMVPVLLGILKAGLAYVPLEPGFPQARIDAALDCLAVPVVITEQAQAARFKQQHVMCVERPDWREQPASPPPARGGAEDLAYVIFTSGSTGAPKGVMVRHRPVVNLIDWVNREFSVSADDQVLFVTSLCFDLSVYDIFGLLAAGGSIRVAHEHHVDDAETLSALLAAEPVTFWDSAPAMLWQMEPLWPTQPQVQSRLRLVFVSGDWVPLALPERVRQVFPAAQVVALGGATEATVWSNFFPVERAAPHWVSIPYGRPIQNAAYYILDAGLEPLPPGVPGDLYIGGDVLADGYAAAAALTAAKFVANPFRPGERLYRTGDRARFFADGAMEFLGRADRQVKIRGFRIELGEIEAAMARLDGIRDALAVVDDQGGDRRLAVYYTVQPSISLGPDQVRAHCARLLPRYMVPAFAVCLDALPLSANGKVDLKALPSAAASSPGGGHADPLAEVVGQCWAGVLECDHVGPEDNFFDLGGHSLRATMAIARLRAALGRDIPLRLLFDNPTPAAFAGAVRALDGADGGEVVPQPVQSAAGVLSAAQRRLWFVCSLDPNSPFYNIVLAARCSGRLDHAALERAVTAILVRHQVLRTRIVVEGGEPRPVVDSDPALPVIRQSCSNLEAARAIIEAEARRSFDLGTDRLLRLVIVGVGDNEHVVAVICHHIVADGWSMGVLLDELRAGLAGETLAPLALQYGDFAVWHNNWLSAGALERQQAWWRRHLAGAPALALPTDRPEADGNAGKVASLSLGEELATAVRTLARAEGVTPFMVLQAAFSALMHQRSGQTDIVTGTDVAGRSRPELERLIGFFVNQLVVRLDLSGDPTFAALLGRARATLLAAYAHQDLPFDQLVATLNPPRRPGRMPLFQVKLVFQNAPLPSLAMPGLTIAPLTVDTATAKYDLLLTFEDSPDLAGRCEYNTSLFDAATIDGLLAHFVALLRLACANPAQHLAALCASLAADEAERSRQVQRALRQAGLAKLRALRS